MRLQLASPDALIAVIAGRQHGVVTYEQLRHCGLTQSAIQRRVAAGRLHRLYRGVYAVGHRPTSDRGRWKAATLAHGTSAVLSHRSAAELWGLIEAGGGEVHVSIPAAAGRARRDGIALHRVPSLQRGETTSEDNIPVTKPHRTLVDFKRQATQGEFRRALREAEFRRLPVVPSGLASDGAGNELELAFIRLCRRHRLPIPKANVVVEGYEVDFVWPEQRLIAEADGYEAHSGSVAFEEDRRRDARLSAAGYRILRFTHRQITDEPAEVAAILRQHLTRGEL